MWSRWGVLEARWSGKFDENGEPLTIQYSDHNGTYESYFLAPWYKETSGGVYGYSFNERRAKAIAEAKNKNE